MVAVPQTQLGDKMNFLKIFLVIVMTTVLSAGQDLAQWPTPREPLTVEEKVVAAEALRIHQGTWVYAQITLKQLQATEAWASYQNNLKREREVVGKTMAAGTGLCGFVLVAGLSKYGGSQATPTALLCLGVTGVGAGSMFLQKEKTAWNKVLAPDKEKALQLLGELEYQAKMIGDARLSYNTATWNASNLPSDWPKRLDLFQIQ